MLQIDENAIRKIVIDTMQDVFESFLIKMNAQKCAMAENDEKARKQRRDKGIARKNGNGTTVFYTPELCKLIGLKDCRAVHYEVVRFNAVNKDKISMPGSSKTGYRASRNVWKKFFLTYGKNSF